MRSSKYEKMLWLYDFAGNCPDGFTHADVEAQFGWGRNDFFKVVRDLRLLFKDREITLVCDPQGQGELWRYRLVGSYDEARQWATNRIHDLESRLETVGAVAEAIVNATDGRSIEGRKARKLQRVVGRLIEDLAEIDAS